MNEAILLRDACVGYRHHASCHPLTAPLSGSLRRGQLTCLLGSNGVGKSTLLRTLAGLQPPLAGDVLLADGDATRPLSSFTARQLARMVGVVLTLRPPVSQLTVAEVVGMGRQPYTGFWGRLSADDRLVVDEAMRQVGITHLAGRSIGTLSDGERQKTMIAKALAQRTPVILLDEPTAFLDFPSKVEVLQLLRQLAHSRRFAILLSTHDLELALRLADTLWLMRSDEGLVAGTPRQLADSGHLSRYVEQGDLRLDPRDLSIHVVGE